MKPLGVRMINIDFYPLIGGAQMHTLRLCRYLRARGVNVEVITRHHPGLAFEEEIEGVPVYRTPILHDSKAGASLSFTFYALKRLAAQRDQFQIVHSHEMISPMTIGLLARALLGKRLVINPHRGGYLGDIYKLQKKRRFSGQARLDWARRSGDAFIAISNQIHCELAEQGISEERIHAIPCGLDTGQFQPVDQQRRALLRKVLGMEANALYACYSGRLVPEKGLDVLLNAWKRLLQDCPDARLLIIGDGDQRAALEQLAGKLALGGSIQFTGGVKDTAPYLQASDLYVQPSFTEGLPVSMLEAMACRLPILATDVGGVGDIIVHRRNGLLIAPRDVDALTTHLIDLTSNQTLRQELGTGAQRDVAAYCSIEKVGQAHLALYHQLAGVS